MHDRCWTTERLNTRPATVLPERSGETSGKVALGVCNTFWHPHREITGLESEGEYRQREVISHTERMEEVLKGNTRPTKFANHDRSIEGNS